MQCFLGDPYSGILNLETHRLALAIAKKTLDENRFTATQKTMAQDKPAFQIRDCVYFKNKQPGKWDLKGDPDIELSALSATDISYILKTKPLEKIQSCSVTDIILEPPIEFWNVDTQFGRAGRDIYHPTNLPTIKLMDT